MTKQTQALEAPQTERYICIHGHFYQPPRENPWLEEVEVEDSAAPFHDWNERVCAECYSPNTVSRLLDSTDRIEALVNNYTKISFNFGPTLLGWLEAHQSGTYKKIIEADHISREQHGGHGNAIAQCYNHIIMPLASRRDKITQVRWGIADFEKHFGRKPEGIWLPESAVDTETLEVLSDHGIAFTILSPYQAAAVRPFRKPSQDVTGGKIDPSCAYRCHMKKRKHIDLFFYDGPISADIGFSGLLKSGDKFAERLLQGFDPNRTHAQLMNVATDGETFGHHYRFGEMALSYALEKIEDERLALITNYAEYLESHPPRHVVRILENSSWSCSHGIERWRSDCGCKTIDKDWNQRWRSPLRASLDALKIELDSIFEREGTHYLIDPWEARNDYIRVILERTDESCEAFLKDHQKGCLDPPSRVTVWKLLELERHAMLIFTSCGWFFDDISNIATIKILEYAARAIQLAREVSGIDLEPVFLHRLKDAQSNLPEYGDGAAIYQTIVNPSIVDLNKSLAHYAISSLVEDYSAKERIFSFEFEQSDYTPQKIANRTLAIGSVKIRSIITREEADNIFSVLHLGGYDFHCALKEGVTLEEYELLRERLLRVFMEDSTHDLLRLIDETIGGNGFGLKDLFIDEKRKIGLLLLETALDEAHVHYEHIYEQTRDVVRLLASLRIPVPGMLKTAVENMLNYKLRRITTELHGDGISPWDDVVTGVLREAAALGCNADVSALSAAISEAVYSKLQRYGTARSESDAEFVAGLLRLASKLNVSLDLSQPQNLFWELLNQDSKTLNKSPYFMELGLALGFSEKLIQPHA